MDHEAEKQLRAVRLETVRESIRSIRHEAWAVFDAWRRCAAEKADFSGLGDPVLVLLRIWLFVGILQAAAYWKIGFGLPAPAIAAALEWCRAAIVPLDGPCDCLPEDAA